MKITFLHTAVSHIDRFNKIVEDIDHAVEVKHYVNESLLNTALTTGLPDKEGFYNEILKIKKSTEGIIICTCSTYGSLCDKMENVFRIDQAVVEFIISNFSSVVIAFTINSAKKQSIELFENLSLELQKTIHIKELDCQHCWDWFEQNDIDRYEKEIAKQITKLNSDCEVIFLAQASMEGSKQYLSEEKFKIFASPTFGVRHYLNLIKDRS